MMVIWKQKDNLVLLSLSLLLLFLLLTSLLYLLLSKFLSFDVHWSIFNWGQATTRSVRPQELLVKFLRYQTKPLSLEIPFLQTLLFAEDSFVISSSPHPTTTCVTGTFTPHNRATSLLKSWYFSNFSFTFSSMLAFEGTAMSIIWHCPCCLSKNTMSGLDDAQWRGQLGW